MLSRTDKIPLAKLVGTVFIERLADTVMLFVLAVIIFTSNLDVVTEFFHQHPRMLEKLHSLVAPGNIAIMVAILAAVAGAFRITSYNVCYTKLLRQSG